MPFAAPTSLSILFAALTAAVAVVVVLLVRKAAPPGSRSRWTAIAGTTSVLWMTGHALVARSGVLVGDRMPPPLMLYALAIIAVAIVVATSGLGRRLAALPIGLLIGMQAFRLPLEILLHRLHATGNLPERMTWSGANYDVVTGISAALLGLAWWRRPRSRALAWAWNIMGSILLVVVVAIAFMSAPTPLRQFHDGPPLLLPFHAPYNWIINVHVFVALVGHIVLFRALLQWRAESAEAPPRGNA